MKKMIAGLFAGLILATGAQVLADGWEGGVQRQNTAYCYGGNAGYCYDGDCTQTSRDACANQRSGSCGCGR